MVTVRHCRWKMFYRNQFKTYYRLVTSTWENLYCNVSVIFCFHIKTSCAIKVKMFFKIGMKMGLKFCNVCTGMYVPAVFGSLYLPQRKLPCLDYRMRLGGLRASCGDQTCQHLWMDLWESHRSTAMLECRAWDRGQNSHISPVFVECESNFKVVNLCKWPNSAAVCPMLFPPKATAPLLHRFHPNHWCE